MNFQIIRPSGYVGVDNAAASGLDLSALASNIYIIELREGKCEIEYTDGAPGVREPVNDILPFVQYFQQFLQWLADNAGLTLAQAKSLQSGFVGEIAKVQWQAPYSYLGRSWSALAEDTAAMAFQMLAALPGAINTSINSVAGSVVAHANVSISYIYANDSNVASFINNTMLGTYPGSGSNTINEKLQQVITSIGLLGNIASYGSLQTIPSVTYTASPLAATIAWVPLDSATPVNLSLAQMSTLMSGIATRRRNLNAVLATKLGEIAALTTIPDVIAYDAAKGWPSLYIIFVQGDLVLSTTAPTVEVA